MRWVLLALLLAGCWEQRTASIEVLTAETRRAQVVADIAQLNWVLRHTGRMERRIVIEGILVERRAELDRLNAVIAGR